MKYFAPVLSLSVILMTSGCSGYVSDEKSSWLCCGIPPLEWPERHWVAQDFRPNIEDNAHQLPAAVDRNRSMFDPSDIENTDPDKFIANLKRANIIERVYINLDWLEYDDDGRAAYDIDDRQTGHQKFNVMRRGHHVAEIDQNFYTLTKSDQTIITELLLQSYDTDLIVMKDKRTHRVVGEITPQRFVLF